jgi:hypothetical protein
MKIYLKYTYGISQNQLENKWGNQGLEWETTPRLTFGGAYTQPSFGIVGLSKSSLTMAIGLAP